MDDIYQCPEPKTFGGEGKNCCLISLKFIFLLLVGGSSLSHSNSCTVCFLTILLGPEGRRNTTHTLTNKRKTA